MGVKVENNHYSSWSLPEPFAEYGNRVIRLMKAHDGRDKVIKLAVAASEVNNALLKALDVSKNTQSSCHKLTHVLKDTRTVTGLMNIFGTVLKNFVISIFKVIDLSKSFFSDKPLDLNNDISDEKKKNLTRKELFGRELNMYNDKTEKGLGLLSESTKAIGGVAYTAGFGICRPILFAGKLTELSKNAKNIGEKFGYCMFALHLTSVVWNVSEFVRVGTVHSRVNNYNEVYRSKVITFYLDMAETLADLSVDVITLFCNSVHSAVALSLNLFIGIISLVKVWRDTAD